MRKKPQQVNLLAEFFPEEAPAPVPLPSPHRTDTHKGKRKGKVTPMPRLDLPDIGDNEVVKMWRWFGHEEGGSWNYTGTVGFYYSVRQVMRLKTDIALPHGVTPDQLNPLDD